MYTLSAPYFAAQVAAAVDEAKKAGCEVSQSDGQNDMNKQISDVEDMVAKGVNLLILNPRDPEGLVAAANAATKAGVKVVVMDSSIKPKAHVITQVRSSNDQNGYLVGQWLAKTMEGKPIRMILLSGSQGNEVGRDRRLGVFKGLLEGQLVNEGHAGFQVLGQGRGSWSTDGGAEGGRRYGATGLNDPDLVARTAIDIGVKALKGELPADYPKLVLTKPDVITKENVDKYYRKDAVF